MTSQLQNPSAKVLQSNEKLPDCNQSLEQSVEPHNDFFSAQFLLPFTVPGTHLVRLPFIKKLVTFSEIEKALFLIELTKNFSPKVDCKIKEENLCNITLFDLLDFRLGRSSRLVHPEFAQSCSL